MALQLRYVAHSEIGLVRKNNQDSGYASPTLLVVADGMGGAAAGDLASAVAIAEVTAADVELRASAHRNGPATDQQPPAAEHQADQGDPTSGTEQDEPDDQTEPEHRTEPGDEADRVDESSPADETTPAGEALESEPIDPHDVTLVPEEMLEVLAGIVSRANDRIADLVAADHALEGMGTTLDAGMFDGEQLALAHIGDSRVYLLREGVLQRLTHDHSWVQSLVDDGRISPEEAAYHPHRSLLLKVLNGQPANDPDLSTHQMLPGDRLLFCSDGLCGLVEDTVMEPILNGTDPEEALSQLVAAAHAEGGIDNITILIADLVQAEPDADLAEVMVLGAAGSTDIPDVSVRPQKIDLGDEDAEPDPDDDAPSAPPPRSPSRSSAGASSVASPTDHETERYALQQPPPTRWRVLRVALTLALVVLLLGGATTGAIAWGRTQYFVGAADDRIAIYRGLPETVAGVELNQVYEIQQTAIADLPLLYQDRVRSHIEARDLADARSTVTELAEVSGECIRQREERAQSTATPTPSPEPSDSPSPSPSSSPSPSGDPVPPEDESC